MPENNDHQDLLAQLFRRVSQADPDSLLRSVSEKEDLQPKEDPITAKDKEGDLSVRQALRNTRKGLIYLGGFCIGLLVLGFFATVLYVGGVYVGMKLETPEGTADLVRTWAGFVGVAAATLVIEQGIKRFPK